jgi:hypothetical protein
MTGDQQVWTVFPWYGFVVLRHAGNARSFGGALIIVNQTSPCCWKHARRYHGVGHACMHPPIIIQSSVNFIISSFIIIFIDHHLVDCR